MSFLLAFSLFLAGSVAFGQSEKTISAMKAGAVLTNDDIGFLTMVSNTSIDPSRGAPVRQATINKVTYKPGQTLTAANAKSINAAIKAFQKTYKAPAATRGAGWCYYWYYYCDIYGYCYWYKYWYYC